MVGYSSDVKELEGGGGHPETSSRVQAVVNFYGPVDLTTDFAKGRKEPVNLIGKSYEEAPEIHLQASPIQYLTKDDPPTLIFQGTIDDIVPVDQGDMLAAKLKELGIPCVYDRIEGWPHTMDLAADIHKRCVYQMEKFLTEHLGGGN
jgi:dipeptidyl aminopeptidase/acylaminoacyl peptidase